MTHTQVAFRQYSKPVVTVVDGVSYPDGDFNVLRLTTDDPVTFPGPAAVIQAAYDSVKTLGGTLYIRAGSYPLETEVSCSGTTAPVTITGDGDATAIVKSGGVASVRSVLNPGDIGVNTVTVTLPGGGIIRFTRSAGTWAYQPYPNENLTVAGNFNVANRGTFTIKDATTTVIDVYSVTAGFAEAGITLSSVNDMAVRGCAFRVTENIQNITIEKLGLSRPATVLGSGELVVVEQGADHITVQDCILSGNPNAAGSDILVVGRSSDTTDIDVLRNRFIGDADVITRRSFGVSLVGRVQFITTERNGFEGLRNRHVVVQDFASAPTLLGHDICIECNNASGEMAPSGLSWPIGSVSASILVSGMFTKVDILDNKLDFTLSHGNVAMSGVSVTSGNTPAGHAAADMHVNVRNNRVYLSRLGGTSNLLDRAVSVDYASAFIGASPRAKFVDVSDNDWRIESGLETSTGYVGYASVLRFCNNKGIGTSGVFLERCTGGTQGGNVVVGNYLEATANGRDGLRLTNDSWFTIQGNTLKSAGGGGLGLNVVSCPNSVIGPNLVTQESSIVSADPATSYNVNKQIVKAWARTNYDGTLLAGYNLTVVATPTGGDCEYTYTFLRPMKSANYSIVSILLGHNEKIVLVDDSPLPTLTAFVLRVYSGASNNVGHFVMVCGESAD